MRLCTTSFRSAPRGMRPTEVVLNHFAFFAAAALAFAAFFLLLRIMTIARNEPTTVDASRVRITGIRMAHTRGGKMPWSGWSSSTKGCDRQSCTHLSSCVHTMKSVHTV